MFFDELHKRKIDVHMLVGNHDTYYKNTNEVNSMTQMYGDRAYDTMKVIVDPTELTIGGTKLVLMPWMCQDNMDQALDLIKNTKAQVLFGHLELAGFEMYKGSVIDHGMDSKVFDKFDVVCSGHYHHKSTRGNINYLGCPYEITWSDYGDQKGFHVYDTETRELEFIHNPYGMFQKIYYDDAVWSGNLNDYDFTALRNTYVKVIVQVKNNPYWFDLFIDKLEKSDPLSIQVVDDNMHLDLEDDDSIVSEAEDTLSILRKYVDTVDVNVDNKLLDAFITELFNEAQSI
jgi:DNA repair exonuclease SbcCD nuclease subunit